MCLRVFLTLLRAPAATAAAVVLTPQDLEYLISKAVNPKAADYAVVTGVQIHNWASDLDDERVPSMEFVAPARAYVVVNGEKIDLDLQQVPALSPRQLQLLAAQSVQHVETSKQLTTGTPNSMLQEIPRDYLLNRLGGVNTTVHMDVEHQGPSWREYITTTYHDSHHNAPKMDEHVSRALVHARGSLLRDNGCCGHPLLRVPQQVCFASAALTWPKSAGCLLHTKPDWCCSCVAAAAPAVLRGQALNAPHPPDVWRRRHCVWGAHAPWSVIWACRLRPWAVVPHSFISRVIVLSTVVMRRGLFEGVTGCMHDAAPVRLSLCWGAHFF